MRDLNDVLDLTLELPIGGKVYRVEPPIAAIGANLMNRLALGIAVEAGITVGDEDRRAAVVTDEELPDFGRQCLGPVLAELEADGIDPQRIEFCITTAFWAWTVGKEYAEHFWETGGKALAPAVSSPQAPPTETPTRMAAASGTPSSASASGTTPPPRKPRKRRA